MARGRRSKQPRKQSRRQPRTRRLGKINILPALPPSLDLQSNVFTCWLRTETGVSASQTYWVNEWTFDEMLTAEYKTLSSVFAEYRLKRVNVWFIPSVSITETGIHAMAVYDDGDNYFITPSLSDICSAPGSHTAKCFQPLRSAWHRSEPKDKNWLPCNDVAKPMSVALATSHTSLKGVIILDIHIAFRGLKAASTKLRRFDVGEGSSLGEFERLQLDEQE